MGQVSKDYVPKATSTNLDLTNFDQSAIFQNASDDIGIGTDDPKAKLHIDGDLVTKGPWFDVRAFGAACDGSTNDKRAIQNAIDAAALTGGTVLIPAGNCSVQVIGGTATGGSASTIIDTNLNFSLDIEPGDLVINITRNCAGIIGSIDENNHTITFQPIYYDNTQYYLIGNSDPSQNIFCADDVYCIPGLVMKNAVELIGVGTIGNDTPVFAHASTLTATVCDASGNSDFTGPIVFISVYPLIGSPYFSIRNLTLQRNPVLPSWATSFRNYDIGIDTYNHVLSVISESESHSCPAIPTIERVFIPDPGMDGYQFLTGLRMAGWCGIVSQSTIHGCLTGIDLSLPNNQTNAIVVRECYVNAGGPTNTRDRRECIRITGINNLVIGCTLSSGFDGGARNGVIMINLTGDEFITLPKLHNNIIGTYFDGNGEYCTGVGFDLVSYDNIITGCHFDLGLINNNLTAFLEDPDVQGRNTFLSNGTPQICNPCIAGNTGFNTSAPESAVDVRGILTVQNPAGSNACDITIKRPGSLSVSNIAFVLNERDDNQQMFLFGHDGTTYKNFIHFDYPNHKIYLPGSWIPTLVVDGGNGIVGIGTTTPAQKLDVSGNVKVTGNGNGIYLTSPNGAYTKMLRLSNSGTLEVV